MEDVCREIDIPDCVDKTIIEINRKLSNEITAFRGQMKEINFPRTLPERCWKIQSKMKLFIVSKRDDDIDAFLEWSMPESYGEGTRLNFSDVEKALKQARVEDHFILSIVLVSRADLLEKPQVYNFKSLKIKVKYFSY